MNLKIVNELWGKIQEEQQALITAWIPEPNVFLSTNDPFAMAQYLSEIMIDLNNTDTIISLQYEFVQAQGQLSAEDFKIWFLDQKTRINEAGENHSKILTQKLMDMMELIQSSTNSTVH